MLTTYFPCCISKKLGEIPIFGTFLAKKFNFVLYFAENRLFLVGHVLLRHCDVKGWPIFMILISLERRACTLYHGTKQIYFGSVSFKSTPSGRRVKKEKKKKKKKKNEKKKGLRKTRVKMVSVWVNWIISTKIMAILSEAAWKFRHFCYTFMCKDAYSANF